ncbi:unnamed protein product [Timema podura]|uniref:Abscisic acid G-protein coupled receptor-like domain-containing protein n=1 Tax=Timema podura TaxID=61482 RepID=A0ABN7NTX7_TIMPD|nr:unnamed protein product [Timema podura]
MHNMAERLAWSSTLQGRYFNFLGYFFSLYCTWKIFISTINIVFDRVGKKDPVTRGMEIAVHWVGIDMDVTFWSQHISFFLVGCIVLTSIRGLLLTLTKFFYAISSSKSSNIIVLVLAQIMVEMQRPIATSREPYFQFQEIMKRQHLSKSRA